MAEPNKDQDTARPAPDKAPGDERQDTTRTPGDGTLQGATPAGLTSDELRQRAEDDDSSSEPGTG